jgi:hypothetical protein
MDCVRAPRQMIRKGIESETRCEAEIIEGRGPYHSWGGERKIQRSVVTSTVVVQVHVPASCD